MISAKIAEQIKRSVAVRITCRACGSFLGKFIEGRAAFWCHRCRRMVEIDSQKTVNVS